MKLTPEEAAWLYRWFREHRKGMPSPRSFQPHYDATSWDLEELFGAFREEALEPPAKMSSVVNALVAERKWPRMRTRDAFWMEARWGEAEGHCLILSGIQLGSDLPIYVTPPQEPRAAIEWLLQWAWETRFVDLWLRDNARSYVSVDDYSIQESITDLEIFLRKLEGKLR
jgi:hypothetical protein